MSARLEKFKYTQNRETVVNDELVIPVPDGYQYYSEVEEGIGTRLLIITPEGYPRTADPFDAEFSMVITQYASVGIPFDPEKAEPYKVLFMSNYPVFTEGVIVDDLACRENFGILHQSFYNEDDPTWNNILAMIFVNSGTYVADIYFNHPGYDALNDELIDHFISDVDEWMGKFRLITESLVSTVTIPSATPDKKLYSRYNQAASMSHLSDSGFAVVVNATGADYQFISFSQAIKDEDISDDSKTAYQRIIDADTKGFSLSDEADRMKSLFRLSPSKFNMKHDRECEINEGYIHKAYMLIALRSFAWTLAAYCANSSKTPADLSFDELKTIVKYCEKKDWLNFDNQSYCKGLCDNEELHIFFVPDSVSDADKKRFEPTQEDYDRVESMRRAFPAYNEILTQVRSLDSLRTDLEYVYPAITVFYNELSEDRNYDEELTGNIADILYAWCSITKAASEPFYVEDGPSNCWYEQISGDIPQPNQTKTVKQDKPSTPPTKKENITSSSKPTDNEPLQVIQLKEKSKGVEFEYGEFQGYKGSLKHIALPEETDTIGYGAMSCNATVKTVVIPEGVTTIDMDAFSLAKLSCVVFPSTLITISSGAFRWCGNLKEIVLPDGLIEIGDDAFSGCDSLKYIYIPSSVFDFGMDCFDGLDDCIFHIEPGSNAEEYLRDNYENYHIVFSKPSEYGNKVSVNVIPYVKPKDETGLFLLTTDDEDVASISEGELTRYFGKESRISISEDFYVICREAFYGNGDLEKIVIPSTITEIGDAVFCFCEKLKEVIIHCDIDAIPAITFSRCHSLESIVLPDTITSIEEGAFCDCKKLKSISLPKGIECIGVRAFSECESLESIVIPDSVTVIEKAAFSNCKNLRSIILSKSIETIGEDAFMECERLESIIIPDSVKKIGDYAFRDCKQLKNIVLPNHVDSVGEDVFLNCNELDTSVLPSAFVSSEQPVYDNTGIDPNLVIEDGVLVRVKKKAEGTVVVPCNVRKIAQKAFAGCTKVKEIIISEGVVEIEDGAIGGASNTCSIKLPSSLKMLGSMFRMEELTEITIPEGIKEIPDGCFKYCGKLKRINLPSGLMKIGEGAFANTAIKDIIIPDTVTHIGDKAFQNTDIEEIIIPDSVTYIGDSAFSVSLSNKSVLEKVIMSERIIEIGESVFKDTSITEIALPNTLKSMGKGVFSGCKFLQNVKLSSNLTAIPDSAFSECENLSSITIPKGVTKIGKNAFWNCISLNGIVIADSVTTLDDCVFGGCKCLRDVKLSANLTAIPYSTFWRCEELDNIILGDKVNSIGEKAFSGCKKLSSIAIPEGVTRIEEDTFSCCDGLENVYLPASLEEIVGYKAFGFDIKEFFVPKGSYAENYVKKNYTINTVINYI